MAFVLNADPMPLLREQRKKAVNENFNKTAVANAHTDQAYAQKRQWAQTKDQRLKPEADLRNITVSELADLILSKSDTVAERELLRQKVMIRIDAANTPQELDAIAKDLV